MALRPGTRFGVYEVSGKVGGGGMEEASQARVTKLNRGAFLLARVAERRDPVLYSPRC
jgi:hypothetical protein